MVGKEETLYRFMSFCPSRRSQFRRSGTNEPASSSTSPSEKTLSSSSMHHEHQVVWK